MAEKRKIYRKSFKWYLRGKETDSAIHSDDWCRMRLVHTSSISIKQILNKPILAKSGSVLSGGCLILGDSAASCCP
jgi:hypothetical protein